MALRPMTKSNLSSYRVDHMLANLAWVDLDFCILPSCPIEQPLLPNSQNAQVELGTLKIQAYPTLGGQMVHPVKLAEAFLQPDKAVFTLQPNGSVGKSVTVTDFCCTR